MWFYIKIKINLCTNRSGVNYGVTMSVNLKTGSRVSATDHRHLLRRHHQNMSNIHQNSLV